MADDVAVLVEGPRTYRVFGLQARAQAVTSAGFELDQMMADRVASAEAALAHWRGAHAATFADEVNRVLRSMGRLRRQLRRAGRVLSAFPESPGGNWLTDLVAGWLGDDDAPRVDEPVADGAASARIVDLRAYVATAAGQDDRLGSLAGTVTLDGVWAEVTYEEGLPWWSPLAPAVPPGLPGLAAPEPSVVTEPVGDVGRLVDLPDATALVAPLVEESGSVSTFAAGVALAFEHGDQALLDLLAGHPGAAVGVVDVLSDGRVDTAEGALAILQARWDLFDTAAEGGDSDGIVSFRDLRAIVEDPDDLAPEVVAAATFLLHNRRFFRLLETADQPGGGADGRVSADDLATFVALSTHLRTLNRDFDRFAGAAEDGDRAGDGRDGVVTEDDLRAVAEGRGPTAEAARWLLDHDAQRERIAGYELLTDHGALPDLLGAPDGISRRAALLLAADQQVFGAYDPATMPLPAGTIPPPPPPPYIDRGAAGMFGDDSDWTFLDDSVSELKWLAVADGAELAGHVDAARHMRHYLDATGTDLILDTDAMLRDVPELRAATDSVVAAEVARIVEAGEQGRPIPFGTGWQAFAFQGIDDNWFYALNSVQHSATGIVTVVPPEVPGGAPTVEVEYQVHLYDRYNWDEGDDPATTEVEQGKSANFPWGEVPDRELAELQRAGLASEYDARGSSGTATYSGAVPEPGSGALPDPPGGRSGRDDPGREPD